LKTRLGFAIKRKRSALGISQEELAERAGLHRTYVSDLERGARNPSIESIERLAEALQTSVSKLFEIAPSSNGAARPVEILLVEDDPADVELTQYAFAKAKITNKLHVARDGAEALDLLLASEPSATLDRGALIVLLDLYLPKMNGLEVLRRMKADARTREIPVIVLTASTRDQDMRECRRLGVENYIVKPVRFENFSAITPRLSLEWMLMRPRLGHREAA
jgi:CheY-like chemotaxis protein/DNA-binding Xre family transcriptional regulator